MFFYYFLQHLQDKISDEMMQSDGWGSQRSRFSGGSGDGRIDDEDYDFSGSGSGAGDYNRYIVKKYPSGSKGKDCSFKCTFKYSSFYQFS